MLSLAFLAVAADSVNIDQQNSSSRNRKMARFLISAKILIFRVAMGTETIYFIQNLVNQSVIF